VTRILTTHAGSLPRPRALAELHGRRSRGEPVDPGQLQHAILPRLYQARVGALVISMANARHAHEYRCFASEPLPAPMRLVAGVIDTTSNYVEHPEVVADRLERIVNVVGDPSRIIAGTDCGFDTSAGIGDVAPSLVWEKLRALRAGADLASARLS
jgi:5-methyltetrahydropteroyltriglutamate--homocysteine methyltransferase